MKTWRLAPACIAERDKHEIKLEQTGETRLVDEIKIYGTGIGGIALFLISPNIYLSLFCLILGVSCCAVLLSRIPFTSSAVISNKSKSILCSRTFHKLAFWMRREEIVIRFSEIRAIRNTIEGLPFGQMEKINLNVGMKSKLEFLFINRSSDYEEILEYLTRAIYESGENAQSRISELETGSFPDLPALYGIYPIDLYVFAYAISAGYLTFLGSFLYPSIQERAAIFIGIVSGWTYSVMATKSFGPRFGTYSLAVTTTAYLLINIISSQVWGSRLEFNVRAISSLTVGCIIAWFLPRIIQFEWIASRPALMDKKNLVKYLVLVTFLLIIVFGSALLVSTL